MMAKKQFYAVRKGRQPGIYEAWFGAEGAEAQVKGVAGAEYRGFVTLEEAQAWLAGGNEPQPVERQQLSFLPGQSEKSAQVQAAPPDAPAQEVDDERVVIYTDGACDPNPGPGGWAALLFIRGREQILTGGAAETTNNRMELTAAVQALGALKEPSRVEVYTDSEYLRRGITEWLAGWKRRGWQRKDGELANVDLWQALDQAIQAHQVEWHWVRGHAGNRENARVDGLARWARGKYNKNAG
jgi:ribonuclease HI